MYQHALCILLILFILCIYRGHKDIVQYVIKRGADVHCRTASGINIEYSLISDCTRITSLYFARIYYCFWMLLSPVF
jgi:hypothetical protein